jgi:hypothetical protein
MAMLGGLVLLGVTYVMVNNNRPQHEGVTEAIDCGIQQSNHDELRYDDRRQECHYPSLGFSVLKRYSSQLDEQRVSHGLEDVDHPPCFLCENP